MLSRLAEIGRHIATIPAATVMLCTGTLHAADISSVSSEVDARRPYIAALFEDALPTRGKACVQAGVGRGVLFAMQTTRDTVVAGTPQRWMRDISLLDNAQLKFGVEMLREEVKSLIPTRRTNIARMLDGLDSGIRAHIGTSQKECGVTYVLKDRDVAPPTLERQIDHRFDTRGTIGDTPQNICLNAGYYLTASGTQLKPSPQNEELVGACRTALGLPREYVPTQIAGASAN